MEQQIEDSVISPCVSVCALDEDDICIGCFRSAEEISCWGDMDSAERRRVLERVAERERAKGAYFRSGR